MRVSRPFISLFAVLVLVAGCGGGGGGDGGGGDFNGAADVSITDAPNEIDPGDRTQVTIEISNVNPDGIGLKVRYPDGLDYVPGSSFLTVNDQRIDITPTVITRKDSFRYLVYYLSMHDFGEDNSGSLDLQLVGVGSVLEGSIGVDPDVDNPQIPNSDEFNADNPGFTAEASVDISVRN